MANNPKKLTDPTDEALTAIQQVLSVSDEPRETRASEPAESRRRREPSLAAVRARTQPPTSRSPHQSYGSAATPNETCSKTRTPSHDDELRPSQYAANDDRQSIGQILQTLQQRPSKTSYVVATAVRARLGGLRRGARVPLSCPTCRRC